MIDLLVEKTKENQTFRGDYMAWGLAEQDAEMPCATPLATPAL